MKKNGFTLVELIAVLAIIGLITGIAVPNLMGVFSEKKEKLYESTKEEIKRITSTYLTENVDLYITIESNGYVDVYIEDLCNEKYITCPINDPRDNSKINGYVRISKDDNHYTYNFVRTE